MMMCNHMDSIESIWLPSSNLLLSPHKYCLKCGVVKNNSSDKAKSLGYFANVLSKIRKILEKRGYKISKSQIRLIMLELKNCIGDTYSITYSKQKELFVEIVRKYIKVSKDFIYSYL